MRWRAGLLERVGILAAILVAVVLGEVETLCSTSNPCAPGPLRSRWRGPK